MADIETPEVQTPTPTPAPAAEQVAATPEKTEPTAAAAAGTTTTTEEAPETTIGEDAVGVEGYEKTVAKALEDAKAAKEKESEERWQQARAAAKADEAGSEADRLAAEGGGAEPAAAVETTPSAEETETPTAEAETTAEEESQRSEKRIRLKGLPDGHLVDAANEIARAENIPFAQAWDRVAPKKAAASEAAPAAAATTEPAAGLRTRDVIQAEISARKSEKKQAATDLDTGKMYEADEAIEALRDELGRVDSEERKAEQQREEAGRTKFGQEVADATAKAIAYWPESEDKESELSKRTVELADAYEKDPALASLVSEANSPFYFTQLAAKELGLLPKHLRKTTAAAPAATAPVKPATPTATKPAPRNQSAVVRPTQPAANPASGAARTTQEGKSKIEDAVDNIRNVSDYERVEQDLKAGRLAMA